MQISDIGTRATYSRGVAAQSKRTREFTSNPAATTTSCTCRKAQTEVLTLQVEYDGKFATNRFDPYITRQGSARRRGVSSNNELVPPGFMVNSLSSVTMKPSTFNLRVKVLSTCSLLVVIIFCNPFHLPCYSFLHTRCRGARWLSVYIL